MKGLRREFNHGGEHKENIYSKPEDENGEKSGRINEMKVKEQKLQAWRRKTAAVKSSRSSSVTLPAFRTALVP